MQTNNQGAEQKIHVIYLTPLILITLLLSVVSCSSVDHQSPNLLLIVIDTCRGDYLHATGRSEAQTPTLDRLCRRGTLFENFTVHAPYTFPSHCSLMTGLLPPEHGVRATGIVKLSEQATTLAEQLSLHGYDCRAFVSSTVLSRRYGIEQGFNVYHDVSVTPEREATANWMVYQGKAVKSLFDERSCQETNQDLFTNLKTQPLKPPFFLWVHYFDPHLPLQPPESFKHMSTLYDGEIAAVDRAIGEVLNSLAQIKLLDNTLIAVTSDHGEGLGDHGEDEHGMLLFEATTKTFLILVHPQFPSNHVASSVTRQIDFVPTVLQTLSLPIPESLKGVALQKTVIHTDSDLEAYSETTDPTNRYGWSSLISVKKNNLKYIHGVASYFYDLLNDPSESHSFQPDGPLSQELEKSMAEYTSMTRTTDTVSEQTEADQERIAQLRSLGYIFKLTPGELQFTGPDPVKLIRAHTEHMNAQKAITERNIEEALTSFKRALELDPDNYEILAEYGNALYAAGLPENAITFLDRALQGNPKQPVALLARGHCAYRQGDIQRAITYYERLIAIIPNHIEALFSLGSCLAQTGAYDRAQRELEKVALLESNKNNWFYQKAASNLERIRALKESR